MAEKHFLFQVDLTGHLHSNTVSTPQRSKSLSIKDLFGPGLFLADESVTNTTYRGKLNSPPRIGIPPFRPGFWAENPTILPFDWSLIIDGPKDSENSDQKCAEVEPVSSIPVDLSQTEKLATVGAGLGNLGNTCFINAVLQCFLHTVPLVRGILSDVQGNCSDIGFCLLCAFSELINLSFNTKTKVVQPWKFIKNLSEFSKSFVGQQQEDAHEFLLCFLNKLENCYSVDGGHSQSVNLVKEVFRGATVSQLKCLKCGHCSKTYEASFDLSLEIENANNLITAIQSFTKFEKIEDPDNLVDCKGCKERVPTEKQLTLPKVPSVAIFHLKRFKSNGTSVKKIDTHVAFPLELDLLPFIVSSGTTDTELKYVLHAVVVHGGEYFASGHYFCFIRLAPNMWYNFNDADVARVREDFVLSQKAYILFYVKEGTSWFSSFINTLPNKQVSLPIKETSSLPLLLKKSPSDASVIGNLDDVQEAAVSPCVSDCADEAVSNPDCTVQLGLPPCKRPLEKLFHDTETETLKQELIASYLEYHDIDNGSRKKSRSDDN